MKKKRPGPHSIPTPPSIAALRKKQAEHRKAGHLNAAGTRGRVQEWDGWKDEFLQHLAAGVSVKLAAEACGLNSNQVRALMHQAEDPGAPQDLKAFVMEINRVKAEGIRSFHDTIREASKKDWKAAAWLLQRRCQEDYGKNETMTLRGPGRNGETLIHLEFTNDWRGVATHEPPELPALPAGQPIEIEHTGDNYPPE